MFGDGQEDNWKCEWMDQENRAKRKMMRDSGME